MHGEFEDAKLFDIVGEEHGLLFAFVLFIMYADR